MKIEVMNCNYCPFARINTEYSEMYCSQAKNLYIDGNYPFSYTNIVPQNCPIKLSDGVISVTLKE